MNQPRGADHCYRAEMPAGTKLASLQKPARFPLLLPPLAGREIRARDGDVQPARRHQFTHPAFWHKHQKWRRPGPTGDHSGQSERRRAGHIDLPTGQRQPAGSVAAASPVSPCRGSWRHRRSARLGPPCRSHLSCVLGQFSFLSTLALCSLLSCQLWILSWLVTHSVLSLN